MKALLKLEEAGQLALVLALMYLVHTPWWGYLLVLAAPLAVLIGHTIGPKVGRTCSALMHHKGLACLVLLFSIPSLLEVTFLVGTDMGTMHTTPPFLLGAVLYGSACLDRLVGISCQLKARTHRP